ncbi:MAG: hypothetical protein ABI577_15290 [bacterium]
MDNDYNVDMEEIASTIRGHDVVVLRFVTVGQRLLLDFRCSDIDGPAVRLVDPVKSVQERYANLRKIRPRFRDPEKIVMVYWPRFTRSLGETDAWREVNARIVDSGHAESVREAEEALRELVRLENEHQRAAVLGAEGFKTLWSRSPAPR